MQLVGIGEAESLEGGLVLLFNHDLVSLELFVRAHRLGLTLGLGASHLGETGALVLEQRVNCYYWGARALHLNLFI